MAQVINLKAPKSVSLMKMGEAEVAKYVSEHADKTLAALPETMKPAGINRVSLGSNLAADPGVWAQWTRACCDRRRRIEDFTDPVMDDFNAAITPLSGIKAGVHIESQMVVHRLEDAKHVSK
jgi:hypothetical protein